MAQSLFSIYMKSKISLKIKNSKVAKMFTIKSWFFCPMDIFERLCSLGAPGILVFCYKLLKLDMTSLIYRIQSFHGRIPIDNIITTFHPTPHKVVYLLQVYGSSIPCFLASLRPSLVIRTKKILRNSANLEPRIATVTTVYEFTNRFRYVY